MMEFRTKDFYLSALLLSKGYKLIGSEKQNARTVVFIFEYDDEQDLNDLLSCFIDMTATANVKKFVVAINDIRNELRKYNL